MSEYQYYEFLALDRPLTEKQRAELRSISSRAEITATRFVNEYQCGDLKGDPRKMLERYFDAYLYLANWGTRQLMFRLPRGVLDSETVGQYLCTDTASLIETSSHLILDLYIDQEEADDYWDEPGGQLAAMVQARSELAAGDLRLLYLAWLLALQSDEVDDEDTEPPVPAGLGKPERGASGGRRFLRDRRGPHRRGGGVEPTDRGASRAGGVDRVPGSGGEGRAAGAGRWWGRRGGASAVVAPFPGCWRYSADGGGAHGG